MSCRFYKARVEGKGELLREWASGSGGWIVATGALGTGVNISGIVHIVHVDRPYGLTSFMQQSGRGGRDGEVSSSHVVIRGGGSGRPEQEETTEACAYSVEAVDEAALSEYLQSSGCRRVVLARHMDGAGEEADCSRTDSILCDRCQEQVQRRIEEEEKMSGSSTRGEGGHAEEVVSQEAGGGSEEGSGSGMIQMMLRSQVGRLDRSRALLDRLQRGCIFCQLIYIENPSRVAHQHRQCLTAEKEGYGIKKYRQWRARLRLAVAQQCYRCGLGQELCQAVEKGMKCEYPHLMLPGIWILSVQGVLGTICEIVEGMGREEESEWQWNEQWPWLNEMGVVAGGERVLNWMLVWEQIGIIYHEIIEKLAPATTG